MYDFSKVRKRFPIFDNSNLIFFDNSSTTQKPDIVIREINDYYLNECANAGRGNYKWSSKIYSKIEQVREQVAHFINAKSSSEIIFTSSSTESSNLLALSFGINNLEDDDEVILCYGDHKSTILPWLNMKKVLNKKIKIIPLLIDKEGDYDEEDLYSKLSEKTKLVVLTQIHNVYGMEMGLDYIIPKLKEYKNIAVVVDASQSVGHMRVDVSLLGADFLYFSGHKMFADTGVGVLWVSDEYRGKLVNIMIGGGEEKLLEAGTPHIAGILSLGKAISFIDEIGLDNIPLHLLELTTYLISSLRVIPNIEFAKGPALCRCVVGHGIVSFKIDGYNSSELALVLGNQNIFVRSGNHCLANNVDDYIRVSLHVYNDKKEIDKFVESVKMVVEEVI